MPPASEPRLCLTSGEVDLVRGVLHGRGGERTALTTKEREVLEFLADRAGEAVTREDLLVQVWGYRADAMTRAADHTIRRLRKKIEVDPSDPTHLLTIHGVGYRLVLAPTPATVRSAPALAHDPDFVGRASELRALTEAVAESRLVTVWGPGGVGKTRLVRHGLVDEHVFVDASEARSGEALVALLADGLGTRPHDLIEVLASRARRVVLDNLEQVASAAAVQIEAWLAAVPTLTIVTTSRTRLGVPGERLVELRGLEAADAVRLFIQRGQAAGGRELDDPRLDAPIRTLVEHLDRLPLAIELAGARAGVLSVQDLIRRMADRHAVLAEGPSEPARHRTLERAIAWSWELLPAPDADALAAFVPFVGGAEVDAVELMLGPGALDRVQRLRDVSLLARLPSEPGIVRLGLLESVRAFVARTVPQAVARHRAAHTEAYLTLSRRWSVGGRAAVLARRTRERDNVLAAARKLLAEQRISAFNGVFSCLEPALRARGPAEAWRQLVDDFRRLAPGPAASSAEARLHLARGDHAAAGKALAGQPESDPDVALALARVARAFGRYGDADTHLERVLGTLADADPRRARALHQRGLVAYDDQRWDDAERLLVAAAEHSGEAVWEVARVSVDRAHLELETGRVWDAHARYAKAARVFDEVGDRRSRAIVISHQALAAQEMAEGVQAEALAGEALGLHRDVGNARFVAFTLLILASLASDRGRWSEAREHAAEARSILVRLGDSTFGAVASARLALAEARLGQAHRAHDLAAEALGGAPAGAFGVGVRLLVAAARGEAFEAPDPAITRRSNFVRISAAQVGPG